MTAQDLMGKAAVKYREGATTAPARGCCKTDRLTCNLFPGPSTCGRRIGGRVREVLLFADGFPHFRLGLRSRRGMDVDIAIKIQLEPLKNRDQGLDVVVGGLSRGRQ